MNFTHSRAMRYVAAAIALSVVPGGWLLLGGRALLAYRRRSLK